MAKHPQLSPHQLEVNQLAVDDFINRHTGTAYSDKIVYIGCRVKYINKTKNTEKTYRDVSVWYTYNEIREMCFIIPELCGRRYRFSQFDLKSCKFKHERRTLYIEGTDWAKTGKGDYCIEILHLEPTK